MKPIPKELWGYLPNVDARERPWWSYLPGADNYIRRDGHVRPAMADLAAVDVAHPMRPPQILVGQVWAIRDRGLLYTSTVASTVIGPDGDNTVYWSNNTHGPHDWTWVRLHGFLLSCPYGQGPWSGPEIP